MFLAGLLLGFDLFQLPTWIIWVMWFVGFSRDGVSYMTINDIEGSAAWALALGPLAIASLVAVWLISNLRAYPIVLTIAVAWLAYELLGHASGAFEAGPFAAGVAVAWRALVVGLLVSGQPMFRRSDWRSSAKVQDSATKPTEI